MARPKIDRTGEEFKTNEGYIITIIEYNNANDVTIQFQDEYKTILKHRKYEECANGRIRNPYARSLYKHGFIGQGIYKTKENNKTTKEYEEWEGMFRRGFDEEYKRKHPTYKDVTVDKRFYCFQDYCKWREHNYYKIEGESFIETDKCCEISGKKVKCSDGEVHHIKPFSEIVREAHILNNIEIKQIVSDYSEEDLETLKNYVAEWHKDTTNAIVLHKDVHKYFHDVFMKGKGRESSVEDIEEFKQRYLNGEFKNLI